MAIATFTPNPRPSPGTGRSNKVNLWESALGNGYVLSAPKGLNHITKEVSLKWDGLTLEQTKAIDAFFTAQGGYKPFWYTLLGETVPRKWTCKDWSTSDSTPMTASATLVENFSNVT